MSSKQVTQEHISALADGELDAGHLPATLAALNAAEGRLAWDIYHQIGDVVRSKDMALALSPNFTASLFARLEAEPTILAPAPVRVGQELAVAANASVFSFASIRRFAAPGFAVAASIAVFAFITTPQSMVAMKGDHQQDNKVAMVAVASTTPDLQEGVVLRDPQIDQYLLAHQRFAPSTYTIAQYARSATFATDSDK